MEIRLPKVLCKNRTAGSRWYSSLWMQRVSLQVGKLNTAVMNPKEDWLIFENTHEAIVDAETWELAQKLRKTPRLHDTLGEANPLTEMCIRDRKSIIRSASIPAA